MLQKACLDDEIVNLPEKDAILHLHEIVRMEDSVCYRVYGHWRSHRILLWSQDFGLLNVKYS